MNRRATPNPPADAAIFRGIIQKHLNGNASRRRKAGRRAGGGAPYRNSGHAGGFGTLRTAAPPLSPSRGDTGGSTGIVFRPAFIGSAHSLCRIAENGRSTARGRNPLRREYRPACTAAPACFPHTLRSVRPAGRAFAFSRERKNAQGGAAAGRVKGPECGAAASEPDAGASGAFGYHGRLRAAPKAAPAFCLFRQLILFPWCCTIGSKEASKWTTLKRWRNGSARAGTS